MTITAVLAHDWSMHAEQVSRDSDFQIVTGWVVGELLREDAKQLVVAHHAFVGGDVRHVTCVPKANVLQRHDFEVAG